MDEEYEEVIDFNRMKKKSFKSSLTPIKKPNEIERHVFEPPLNFNETSDGFEYDNKPTRNCLTVIPNKIEPFSRALVSKTRQKHIPKIVLRSHQ